MTLYEYMKSKEEDDEFIFITIFQKMTLIEEWKLLQNY